MLGLGCLLLGAAVLLFLSSGPKLVPLLLAKYTRSPLVVSSFFFFFNLFIFLFVVVSSFFQNKQRSGHKEIKAILSEPEAQEVFYRLGKRFHGWKVRKKVERSPQ